MRTTWLHRSPGARTLVISFRGQASGAGRAHLFELEDVLARDERADVLAIDAPAVPPLVVRARARLERIVPALRSLRWPLRAPIDRDYELLVVVCQDPSDLYRLGPLEPWQRRCARTVCLAGEVWVRELERRRGELELLSRFDAVFTACRGSTGPLAAAIGKPARWLPPAVDALRFAPPQGRAPERTIDVYALGRRDPARHRALLDVAARRGWFYLFSTTSGQRVPDPREHRERLAALVQRTRYFVVQPARAGDPIARGQPEVGTRYLEGAAGGAVLVGQAPDGGGFHELLDWPDAVFPLPAGGDLGAAFDALEADPERLERARDHAVAGVLRRHDWLHRWELVLGAVGLSPEAGMRERRRRLQDAEAVVVARSTARFDADALGAAIGQALDRVRATLGERRAPPRPAARAIEPPRVALGEPVAFEATAQLADLVQPTALLAHAHEHETAVGAGEPCPQAPGWRSTWWADGRA